MRPLLKLIPVLVIVTACAKTETPAVDTTQVVDAVAPAAPVALAEADVAGTWKGTTSPEGSDSVISRWTQVCAAGSCKGTTEGSTVVVQSTYTLSADSVVGVSKPFRDPAIARGQVIDTWIGHINGDSASGTGAMKLASRPDSVVMRYTFAGSRVR